VVLVAYHVARAIAPADLEEEDVNLIVVDRPGVQSTGRGADGEGTHRL
jgi:hypothetical protein